MLQWALHSAFRERYGSTPFEVFMGGQPRTEFYRALGRDDHEKVAVDRYRPERAQEMVKEVARVLVGLFNEVEIKVEVSREKKRDT